MQGKQAMPCYAMPVVTLHEEFLGELFYQSLKVLHVIFLSVT